MYEHLGNNLDSYKNSVIRVTIEFLGLQCSNKIYDKDESILYGDNLNQAISRQRQKLTQKLKLWLQNVSLQGSGKTQKLLSKEVIHPIKPLLIEKNKIAGDYLQISEKTLDVYLDVYNHPVQLTLEELRSPKLNYAKFVPHQLAKAISASLAALRKYRYGFVSMYRDNSQILLQLLCHTEQTLIRAYFKVINNHLYLLLQHAYTAAAIDCHSVALMVIQLELMLTLVLKVCLEMIYQMLHLLAEEISKRFNTEQANTLMPCF
ncbi:hypothetical protein [Rivularia sp. UHCC 0363]|uniref:hypothetical protein n=1 Tax=Rivularia sp. UHCC 0363 TaxID=3110244 RepID=UPI002B1FC4C5|nr:hypothetical protein [Rivularia sp. UHCC 0363]MEA5595943.1 hypothetical protein [Rivularia sp. UHCC 0363]